MTAADELERMADEFRKKRDSHNESAERHKRDPDGLGWQTQHEVVADAWGAAAAQLRARATELRAAAPVEYAAVNDADGPLVVQLPSMDGWPTDSVIRLSSDSRTVLVQVPAKETIEISRPARESGVRPNLGVSEVAVEVER